jgi:hypothetical protein
MTGQIKVDGAWKSVAGVHSRIDDDWTEIQSGYTKVAGDWKQFYSAAPLSDYELIATAFGTGSSGTITFSSIPQDYKHLQVRYTAKTTTTTIAIYIRFNFNSASSYSYHRLRGAAATVSSDAAPNVSSMEMFNAVENGETANAFNAGIIDILDYSSSTKNTTIRALYGGRLTTSTIALFSGLFFVTNSVTSMQLFLPSGNYNSATRFSLYGIRG